MGQPKWIDLVGAPLLVTSASQRTVSRMNRAAVDLFGFDATHLQLSDVLGRYAADRLAPELADVSAGREITLPCRTALGTRMLGCSVSALPEAGGGDVLLTLLDRGAVRNSDLAAPAWSDMLQQVVERLPVGVEIYDADFNEIFCNAASDAMFGYGYQGAIPHHDDWWAKAFPEPSRRAAAIEEWQERIARVRATPDAVEQAEWDVRCRDGSTRVVQFRFCFIGTLYIIVFWDVTERRRLEEDLRRLAGTDSLTGLQNRRRFFEESQMAFQHAQLNGEPLSLLMLDMDRFKWINDHFGHSAGDAVLREVTRRCRNLLRRSDLFARMGGEEFAILLPGSGEQAAEEVARRLIATIGAPDVDVGTATLAVQASVGVTSRRREDASIEAMLERADSALYQAKALGRNRVTVADGEDA